VASHRFGKVAAQGDGTLVTYDYKSGNKVPIPSEMKRRILEMEGDSLKV